MHTTADEDLVENDWSSLLTDSNLNNEVFEATKKHPGIRANLKIVKGASNTVKADHVIIAKITLQSCHPRKIQPSSSAEI